MPVTIGKVVLYSTEELTKKLDISKPTLRTYIKAGRIKGQKMGGKWYVSEDSLKYFFSPEYAEKKEAEKSIAGFADKL